MPGNTPKRLSLKCTSYNNGRTQDSHNDSTFSSKLATALPSMEAWNKKKSLQTTPQRSQQRNNHGSLEPFEKYQKYLQSIVPQKLPTEEKSNNGRLTTKHTSVIRPLSQVQRSRVSSPDGIDVLNNEKKFHQRFNSSRNSGNKKNNTSNHFFHLSEKDQFSDKKRQFLLPISNAVEHRDYFNDIAEILNEDIGEYNQKNPINENTYLSKLLHQTEVHQKSIDSKQSADLVNSKETESLVKHRNAQLKTRLNTKERRYRMKERADKFQRFEDEKELDFFSQKEILHAAERIIQDVDEEEAEKRRQKLFSDNLVERDEEEIQIIKCSFIQKSPLIQLTDQINFETHVKERITLLDNIENENYRMKYGLDEKSTKEGLNSKSQQVSEGRILTNDMDVKLNITQQENDNDPRAKLFERLSQQTTESYRIRQQARRIHRSLQNSRNISSSNRKSYQEQNSNAMEETIKEITSYQKGLRESKKFDDDKRKISQFLSSIFLESEVKGKVEKQISLEIQPKPKKKKFQIVELPLEKNH